MDLLTRSLHTYLVHIGLNPQALSPQQELDVVHLLYMLPPEDEKALTDYYGLFGAERRSLEEIASALGLSGEDAMDHIDQCVYRLAITPEWQLICKTHKTHNRL